MKNYFTISEFAGLRHININSLRYYEKIGLLKPQYVDPNTKYRYYSAEQLPILDYIIMCINLGIPLKEMKEYVDDEGNVQLQGFLEKGKKKAQERIAEIESNMRMLEHSFKSIESNRNFYKKQGLYTRELEERKIMTSEYFSSALIDMKKVMHEVSILYKIAQQNKLFPILPAGQIIQYSPSKGTKYCLFLEIIDGDTECPYISTIPKGIYSCKQIDLLVSQDLPQMIGESWGNEEELTVIVHNIILEKYSYGTRPSELQKLLIPDETMCLQNNGFQ